MSKAKTLESQIDKMPKSIFIGQNRGLKFSYSKVHDGWKAYYFWTTVGYGDTPLEALLDLEQLIKEMEE